MHTRENTRERVVECMPGKDLYYMNEKGPVTVSYPKHSVVAVPTHSVPYNEKYDEATDSTSVYSEENEVLGDFEEGQDVGIDLHELQASIYLKYGLDFNGLPIRPDSVFTNDVAAAAFTPFVNSNGEHFETPHIALWDYFGGTSCMDLNVVAGDTVMVVAEEYQVRELGPISDKGQSNRYIRLPLKWAAGRWIASNSTRTFEPIFGMIPECFLMSTKFYEENLPLFHEPTWFIGTAEVEYAHKYLCYDKSAMRTGVFVIFSPYWLNINPNEYRPYILMMLSDRDEKEMEIIHSAFDKNARAHHDILAQFNKDFAKMARQMKQALQPPATPATPDKAANAAEGNRTDAGHSSGELVKRKRGSTNERISRSKAGVENDSADVEPGEAPNRVEPSTLKSTIPGNTMKSSLQMNPQKSTATAVPLVNSRYSKYSTIVPTASNRSTATATSGPPTGQEEAVDRDVVDEFKRIVATMDKEMLEALTRPYAVKTFTIQRNSDGNYLLFDTKYSTLYDLVYNLANNDSPLPCKLVYGTMNQSQWARALCAVPPPCNQPRRDAHALSMKCEQLAAKAYDQITEPFLLSSPFEFVSRSLFDPLKKFHKKCADLAGLDQGVIDAATKFAKQFIRPMSTSAEQSKENKAKTPEQRLPPNEFPPDESVLIANSRSYLDIDRLFYDQENPIGTGAFGSVFKGIMWKTAMPPGGRDSVDWMDERMITKVAIKSQHLVMPEKDIRQQWISEIELLANLSHPNIAQMFGFCIREKSKAIIVFELLDGSLQSFLKQIDHKLSMNEQVDFLSQIARGMAYLHALDPPIVHGDLAARNVLIKKHPIDPTRYVLKVTDFGISKITKHEFFAHYDDPHKIPFKWCPPEVLMKREMNVKADVWAYGITAQELYGIGEPYGMMGAEKILPFVNDGHRMERVKMPHFLYEICLKCWRKQPIDRPSFDEIELMLQPFYIENENEHIKVILDREELFEKMKRDAEDAKAAQKK